MPLYSKCSSRLLKRHIRSITSRWSWWELHLAPSYKGHMEYWLLYNINRKIMQRARVINCDWKRIKNKPCPSVIPHSKALTIIKATTFWWCYRNNITYIASNIQQKCIKTQIYLLLHNHFKRSRLGQESTHLCLCIRKMAVSTHAATLSLPLLLQSPFQLMKSSKSQLIMDCKLHVQLWHNLRTNIVL